MFMPKFIISLEIKRLNFIPKINISKMCVHQRINPRNNKLATL